VSLIVALKVPIVVVWVGVGVSKFGYRFSKVVAPMVSNTPWMPKRVECADDESFPDDLQRSASNTIDQLAATYPRPAAEVCCTFRPAGGRCTAKARRCTRC
jgi:hypothetical protein